MSTTIMTKTDESISLFLRTAERMVKNIDALRRKNRPFLGGHRYLSDAELSKRLNINRRTLQDYRNEGKFPYIKLGGKVLYREEDIERVLRENYRPRYKL